jgi:hypothetical protein
MTVEERAKFANDPIVWTGDLADDCTALWAGLMLRAEWMDDDDWWWAVYDMEKAEMVVDAAWEYSGLFVSGAIARAKAEEVARRYLGGMTGGR